VDFGVTHGEAKGRWRGKGWQWKGARGLRGQWTVKEKRLSSCRDGWVTDGSFLGGTPLLTDWLNF
jgi:hypothetical protein